MPPPLPSADAAPAAGPAAAARIALTLFGAPRVLLDGDEVALTVRKTLALLVYVGIEGRTTRRRLADLLWPDLDEATARRNLRRAVHRLRAAGLGAALGGEDEHVELTGVASDMAAFERALAEGRDGEAEAIGRQPLLDGLEIDAAPPFAEWLQRRRERAAQEWRAALARRAAERESAGDLAEAVALHERLLGAEPLREETWRELMRLHDARGDRAAALDLFGRCRALLRDELQLEPLPQTERLAERIATRGELPVDSAASGRVAVPFDASAIPFVARDRELAALAAVSEPVLLIEGDAGVGKSRLGLELWRRRSREAGSVDDVPLLIRFAEMSSSTPFHAVADALRAPAVAARLAGLAVPWRVELSRLLPEWGDGGAAAASSGAEARARLLEALARALAAGAGAGRTVLFDDLHWADASSLELLVHLAQRRAQAPESMPRVHATARSAELARNDAATQALAALAGQGLIARSPLAPFDEWSMLQLVQRLSGSEGGVRFAARLNAATDGIPFFALETIRALIEAGELRVDPRQGWSTRYDETTTDYAELPLPASVVDAVRSRVNRLGPAAMRLLESAALAEDGSSLAELQGATALSDWEALEGIEAAIAAQVIAREGDGYRFVHDLVRFAIASGLGIERRRLLHARLAAALEPAGSSAARVALHWEAAGAGARASAAWVRAGQGALALHAHREAATHFVRAADLADDDTAFALYDQALTSMMQGALQAEGEALLRRLLARTEAPSLHRHRPRVLLRMAEQATHERRYAEAERLALRALREGDSEDYPTSIRVHMRSVAAFAATSLDRPHDALARYQDALAVAVAGGNARARGMMAGSCSLVAVDLDRLADAERYRDMALAALADEVGTVQRAQALSKSSFVLRALGRRSEAIVDLREAAAAARGTRSWTYLPIYLANLCETLVDDGQLEAARAVHAELAATPERADPELEYLVAITGIVVAEGEGRLGDALDAAASAIDAADRIGHFNDRRESRMLAARLLVAVGAEADADAHADAAARLVHPGWQGVLLSVARHRAEGLLARDPSAARKAIAAALSRPFADRVLHAAIDAARLVLARAELALGHTAAARSAIEGVGYSVALEAEATCLRLTAAHADGSGATAARVAAVRWLDDGRVPALAALALQRALLPGPGRKGEAATRRRAQASAQGLADSLRSRPALQASFIRRHRDLLT